MALGNKTLQDLVAPISQRLGHAQVAESVTKPEWQHKPWRITDGMSQAELVDKFIEEAEKLNIRLARTSQADLAKTVAGIIEEGVPEAPDTRTVVVANDERFANAGLYDALSGLACVGDCTVWDPAKGYENVTKAEAATYGITYAVAGIAETATVVQPSSANTGRTTSLLPLVHIAVLDANTILPIMKDILSRYAEQSDNLPSSVCFISGPSATSDIELVRVQGVHGPMYVNYVIVD